ncbi:hypothetical protein BBJ28_00006974 [Nothophytophthora sp. Chile5]|nr:hypothetical protein BBJ28_00006974 [Nothophytophthora sp. Chile5]
MDLQLDIVFGIVGYPSDVRKVFLDPKWGVLSTMKAGGVIVDMTTSEPSLAKEIYEAAKKKGISSLDAPVSGGDVGAREATLSIMVGGDANTVESTMSLFNVMGKNIRHMGGAGAGQHTKMVNQILIATNMIGVVEGLLYAHKSGLDVEEAIRAVSAGAAGSWSISNLGPRIANRNFDPGFFVEHFVKDMGIALKEAERCAYMYTVADCSISCYVTNEALLHCATRLCSMNLSLPGLALSHQLYVAVKVANVYIVCLITFVIFSLDFNFVRQAQGHGRLGTHALMLALEQLNEVAKRKKEGREAVKGREQSLVLPTMDLPEEELKQPLVDPQENAALPRPGSASKQETVASGGNRMMRNPAVDTGDEEEKEDAARGQVPRQQQKLPYAAPNVHPYAVPQYQPQGYGGGNGNGWGSGQDEGFESGGEHGITVDIVFSGMYTLAAAFTIIQGFGMLIHFTYAAGKRIDLPIPVSKGSTYLLRANESLFLHLLLAAEQSHWDSTPWLSCVCGKLPQFLGAAVILYDLKSVVNGVSVEMYLPFLGNYIGRAATILFFAVLCAQTYEYAGWTKFIVLYNLLVATLQGFVYITTKTVTPGQQPQMDDLPDL